jgi:Xaa-Pro aminopeptidase
MPAQAHRRLITAVPDAELVDVSSPSKSSKTMWWRMRMIKTRDEVDRFRRATEIAEEGVKAAAEAASEMLERMVSEGEVGKVESVVVMATGSGLKTLELF